MPSALHRVPCTYDAGQRYDDMLPFIAGLPAGPISHEDLGRIGDEWVSRWSWGDDAKGILVLDHQRADPAEPYRVALRARKA